MRQSIKITIIHTTKCMDIENIMQSNRSQSKKDQILCDPIYMKYSRVGKPIGKIRGCLGLKVG